LIIRIEKAQLVYTKSASPFHNQSANKKT